MQPCCPLLPAPLQYHRIRQRHVHLSRHSRGPKQIVIHTNSERDMISEWVFASSGGVQVISKEATITRWTGPLAARHNISAHSVSVVELLLPPNGFLSP